MLLDVVVPKIESTKVLGGIGDIDGGVDDLGGKVATTDGEEDSLDRVDVGGDEVAKIAGMEGLVGGTISTGEAVGTVGAVMIDANEVV